MRTAVVEDHEVLCGRAISNGRILNVLQVKGEQIAFNPAIRLPAVTFFEKNPCRLRGRN